MSLTSQMDTPPPSVSGGSLGAVGGTVSGPNDSFQEIPEEPVLRNELLILLRVEQEDGRPLPVGTYTERCINLKLVQWTGITPEHLTRINSYDTIIEVAALASVGAISQQLHSMREWEEIPIVVSCIMGKKSYIIDVCQQRTAMIKQRGEAEKEIERTRIEAREQRATLAELIDRVNQQARLIGQLQTQSLTSSVQRFPSNVSKPQPKDEGNTSKMSKTPDLPTFSGELPTPKGEVEFDNWIFRIKMLQQTYVDSVIRNAVVSSVRGIAKTVVRAVGYDAELAQMISHLEDRFGLGETNDTLLLEFYQMVQGPHEKIQDFGSKLECKFKILQERFPGRYATVQLKDRFFSGMHDKMCDSMRYLYDQDDCSFSKLLKASMMAEAESQARHTVKAKAATVVEVPTNPHDSELTSIQSQLDSMAKILKSAQFSKKNRGRNGKKEGGAKSAEVKPQPKSKGPATSAAGPFTGGKPPVQCYGCRGWGHYKRNCPNREPIQGGVEWGNLHGEVAQEGAPLPQVKEHPQNPQ